MVRHDIKLTQSMRYSFPGINDSYLSLALFKGLESRLKGTSRLNRLGNERTRYGSSRFLPLRFHLSSYLCPFFVSMLILFLRRNSQRAISNCPKVLLFKSETILSSFLPHSFRVLFYTESIIKKWNDRNDPFLFSFLPHSFRILFNEISNFRCSEALH